MSEPRRCSECGRRLDGVMAVDPSKPGLAGLLRGEGEELGLVVIAWAGFLALIVLPAAMLFFWALGLALR